MCHILALIQIIFFVFQALSSLIEETDSKNSERINYKPLKKNEKGKLKSFIENKYLSKTGFTFVFKV